MFFLGGHSVYSVQVIQIISLVRILIDVWNCLEC